MPPVLRRRAPPPLPSPTLTESLPPSPPPKPLSPHLQKLDEILNIMLNTFTIEADWLGAKATAKTLLLLHGKKANLPPSLQQWRQKRTDWSHKASTVLATAIKLADVPAALAALHSGADPKAIMTYDGASYDALSCAVLEYFMNFFPMISKKNRTAMVNSLLEWGADPFGNPSDNSFSAMEIALSHKLTELPKRLLCRDFTDDQGKVRLTKECRDRKNDLGETTLQMAIECKGSLSFISWLIEQGADLRSSDNGGNTVLHTLVHEDPDERVVNTNTRYWDLFTDGALKPLLEVRNKEHETPLLAACQCWKAVKLMKLGADITVTDPEGNSILHRLARMCPSLYPSLEQWKELESLGAAFFSSIINQPNNKGETPLMMARMHIIPRLVKMGADITVKNPVTGDTYLHCLAPYIFCDNVAESWPGVKAIPGFAAFINCRNKAGLTPLLLVRHSEGAKMYLQLGADVNATDEEGNTAFHLAAAGKKVGLIQSRYADFDASILTALFNAGGPALLEKKNKDGETAVDLAHKRRWSNKPVKTIVNRMNAIVAAAEKKRKKQDSKPKAKARLSKKR